MIVCLRHCSEWVKPSIQSIRHPVAGLRRTHTALCITREAVLLLSFTFQTFFFPCIKFLARIYRKRKKKLLFFSSFFCWLFIVRASAMALKSKCTIQSWSKRRNCSQANLAELQRALPSYYYSFPVPSGLFYFNLLYARTPMPCGAKWMQMKCKRKMDYGRRVFRMNGRGESWNGNEKK